MVSVLFLAAAEEAIRNSSAGRGWGSPRGVAEGRLKLGGEAMGILTAGTAEGVIPGTEVVSEDLEVIDGKVIEFKGNVDAVETDVDGSGNGVFFSQVEVIHVLGMDVKMPKTVVGAGGP